MQTIMKKFFENKKYETITDLCHLMEKHRSDKSTLLKWHNYSSLYHYLFNDIKDEKLNVFEVGIFEGAKSLWAWEEYFKNSKIYAGDIDTRTFVSSDRIKCFYCDQRSPDAINSMWSSPDLSNLMFDIIIDDGDHSFVSNYTFFVNSIHKLKRGGYFIIEDLLQDNVNDFTARVSELKNKFNLEYIEVFNLPNPDNNLDNNIVVVKK